MKKTVSKTVLLALVLGLFQFSGQTAQAANYTLADVQTHNTQTNCWTIVGTKVYNLTTYISSHPGGVGSIAGICGVNGTTAFTAMHGSSANAQAAMVSLLIGDLVVADTIAPSIPTNLTAAGISTSQINLSWTASTDAVGVTGYNVYRAGAWIGSTTATSFSNTGLAASTTYSYTVAAYDAAGNVSAQSLSASAATLVASTSQDGTAPSTPANLLASVISKNYINLSWSSSTDNVGVNGYKVFRNGMLIGTTRKTSYKSSGLTASTTYSYAVAAFDAQGNTSAWSAPIYATTFSKAQKDEVAPTVPTNLVAKAVSTNRINLTWSASTDNKRVKGYKIFRNGLLIGRAVNSTSYGSVGLTASTSYSYAIAAYDVAGNTSALSATVSANTLAPAKKVQNNKYKKVEKKTIKVEKKLIKKVVIRKTESQNNSYKQREDDDRDSKSKKQNSNSRGSQAKGHK